MKLLRIFLCLWAVMGVFTLKSMDQKIDKDFFGLPPTTPAATFCSYLQRYAEFLLRQDEIMRLAQNMSHRSRTTASLKSNLYKTLDNYQCTETNLGTIASLCLAKRLRSIDDFKRVELPKRGEPGYTFLHSHQSDIADNPDIKHIRAGIFGVAKYVEELSKITVLSQDISERMARLLNEPRFKLFQGECKRYCVPFNVYCAVRLRTSKEYLARLDQQKDDKFLLRDVVQDEQKIIDSYFARRKEFDQCYQSIVKELRDVTIKLLKQKKQQSQRAAIMSCSKRFNGTPFPSTFVFLSLDRENPCNATTTQTASHDTASLSNNNDGDTLLLSDNNNVINQSFSQLMVSDEDSDDNPATTPQDCALISTPEVLSINNTPLSASTLEQESSDHAQGAALSGHDIPAHQEQEPVNDNSSYLKLLADRSFIIDHETCLEYITIADPVNRLKLCLYRADLFNPVKQKLDRTLLWQNYTPNVKQWFMDKNAALQQQGYLDPNNTKRYVASDYEAHKAARIHAFSLLVDELLRSFGNEQEVESRLANQKEKDLCITIPGHFEELDPTKHHALKRTCLFVYLQNSITKQWYHRLIEEKSRHLLVKEYLTRGYYDIAFPPLGS